MSRDEWTDNKKWWMDLLRSAVVFIAATLVAIFVLNDLEDKRQIRQNKETALLSLRQQTIPDFVKASVNYETAAYIAYADLYQWQGIKLTKAMRDYETIHYPAYLSSAELIRASFRNHPNVISSLDDYMKTIEKLFRIYDAVRDVRIDGGEGTPIFPRKSRQQFYEARMEAKKHRGLLLKNISRVVYLE
ncbi:MAG: hypothetical protein PVF75_09305 [Granulosicoccaceae bacterium]|jgi:hypothetical protein